MQSVRVRHHGHWSDRIWQPPWPVAMGTHRYVISGKKNQNFSKKNRQHTPTSIAVVRFAAPDICLISRVRAPHENKRERASERAIFRRYRRYVRPGSTKRRKNRVLGNKEQWILTCTRQTDRTPSSAASASIPFIFFLFPAHLQSHVLVESVRSEVASRILRVSAEDPLPRPPFPSHRENGARSNESRKKRGDCLLRFMPYVRFYAAHDFHQSYTTVSTANYYCLPLTAAAAGWVARLP